MSRTKDRFISYCDHYGIKEDPRDDELLHQLLVQYHVVDESGYPIAHKGVGFTNINEIMDKSYRQ